VEHIGERAKHLKEAHAHANPRARASLTSLTRAAQVTLNIQGEVESHLRLLDQLVCGEARSRSLSLA